MSKNNNPNNTMIWKEIVTLNERVGVVEGKQSMLIKMVMAFNVPILLAVIGIILKLYILGG